MKGFRKLSGGLIVAFCIFLTGCGTNMAQLTETEEELIVAYASGVVAKANKTQAQGLTYLYEKEENNTEMFQDEEQESQEIDLQDTTNDELNNTTDTNEKEVANKVTLTEALNIDSVKAEYQGYQVNSNYVEGNYFALNAKSGHTYLILDIELMNIAQEAIECNVMGRNLSCGIRINGEKAIQAVPTIMLSDFLTYVGNIDVNSVVDTILIFEVPKEAAESIQTLMLEVNVEGTTYNVELE